MILKNMKRLKQKSKKERERQWQEKKQTRLLKMNGNDKKGTKRRFSNAKRKATPKTPEKTDLMSKLAKMKQSSEKENAVLRTQM